MKRVNPLQKQTTPLTQEDPKEALRTAIRHANVKGIRTLLAEGVPFTESYTDGTNVIGLPIKGFTAFELAVKTHSPEIVDPFLEKLASNETSTSTGLMSSLAARFLSTPAYHYVELALDNNDLNMAQHLKTKGCLQTLDNQTRFSWMIKYAKARKYDAVEFILQDAASFSAERLSQENYNIILDMIKFAIVTGKEIFLQRIFATLSQLSYQGITLEARIAENSKLFGDATLCDFAFSFPHIGVIKTVISAIDLGRMLVVNENVIKILNHPTVSGENRAAALKLLFVTPLSGENRISVLKWLLETAEQQQAQQKYKNIRSSNIQIDLSGWESCKEIIAYQAFVYSFNHNLSDVLDYLLTSNISLFPRCYLKYDHGEFTLVAIEPVTMDKLATVIVERSLQRRADFISFFQIYLNSKEIKNRIFCGRIEEYMQDRQYAKLEEYISFFYWNWIASRTVKSVFEIAVAQSIPNNRGFNLFKLILLNKIAVFLTLTPTNTNDIGSVLQALDAKNNSVSKNPDENKLVKALFSDIQYWLKSNKDKANAKSEHTNNDHQAELDLIHSLFAKIKEQQLLSADNVKLCESMLAKNELEIETSASILPSVVSNTSLSFEQGPTIAAYDPAKLVTAGKTETDDVPETTQEIYSLKADNKNLQETNQRLQARICELEQELAATKLKRESSTCAGNAIPQAESQEQQNGFAGMLMSDIFPPHVQEELNNMPFPSASQGKTAS